MRWQHTLVVPRGRKLRTRAALLAAILVVELLDRPDSLQRLAPRRREREAVAQFPLFTAEVLGALRT